MVHDTVTFLIWVSASLGLTLAGIITIIQNERKFQKHEEIKEILLRVLKSHGSRSVAGLWFLCSCHNFYFSDVEQCLIELEEDRLVRKDPLENYRLPLEVH